MNGEGWYRKNRALMVDMAKEMRRISDALWNLAIDMEDEIWTESITKGTESNTRDVPRS